MRKRLAALLLTAVMVMPLAACTNSGADDEEGIPSGESTSSEDAAEGANEDTEGVSEAGNTDEIVEIIWQYPTTGNLGSGFQDMEDALNEMMERDIGVHVTFEPVGLMEAQQQAMLMVSAGEQLDICLTAFTSMSPLVTGNLIHPLDDLVEAYGQEMVEAGLEPSMGSFAGEVYGIPTIDSLRNDYGFLAKTQYLEKYDIEVDEEKIYTMQEIEEIFEIIKEGEGDNFYCEIPWNTTPEPLNNGYIEYDKIAGSLAEGVLMLNRSFDDLTVYNLFATEEYEEYAKTKYNWAQSGYISPDAAVTTEAPDILASTDNYLGTFYWGGQVSALDYGSTVGEDLTLLKMVDGYAAYRGGSDILWSIPITSANPEKAMQAINYIYTHDEANWIIQFGLEGETYEIVEETESGIQIKYLSEDTESLPYFNPYGLWGNKLRDLAVYPTPANRNEIIAEEYSSLADDRYSPAFGYNFIPDNVATEIAAVTTVIDQYTPSINSGALDPEQALPEFINALEAAGIHTIIEENQRQLDEWANQQ